MKIEGVPDFQDDLKNKWDLQIADTPISLNIKAGDYTWSFDGDLERDASVMIESGARTVNIIVPQGVNAQVTFYGGLTTGNTEGKWEQSGNGYTE